MNVTTGTVHLSIEDAIKAGESREDLVEVFGTWDQVNELSRRVKLGEKELAKREARKAIQKESRRKNR